MHSLSVPSSLDGGCCRFKIIFWRRTLQFLEEKLRVKKTTSRLHLLPRRNPFIADVMVDQS